MRLPSFSIAEMTAIVAIVALDCPVIRVANSVPAIPLFVLGGLPMQFVLVIGLLVVLERRRRMQESSPFLLGFEIFGSIGHLIYVAFCVRAALSIDTHLVKILTPLLNTTGFKRFSAPDMVVRIILGLSYLAGPQLAIALAGGWIRQPSRKRIDSEPVPVHD